MASYGSAVGGGGQASRGSRTAEGETEHPRPTNRWPVAREASPGQAREGCNRPPFPGRRDPAGAIVDEADIEHGEIGTAAERVFAHLLPYQRQVLRCDSRFTWNCWARQTGKSL